MELRNNLKLRGLGLLGAGLLIGHLTAGGATTAQTPAQPSPVKQASASETVPPTAPAEGKRIVAYIFGNVPLYREDFGEFLMARKGAERIDLYVNKMIVETAAKRRGIEATASEIEATIEADRGNQFSRDDFEKIVRQQYGCSVLEWKDDVIRPRILLSKMGRERMANLKIDDAEIKAEYDIIHGKRVKVKLITWPDYKAALRVYDQIRSSAEEFDRAARKQGDAGLASSGGVVLPFAKGSTKDKKLEEAAFGLKEGETSAIVDTGGCHLVMRCMGYEDGPPGDYAAERPAIEKKLREKKLEETCVQLVKELKKEAAPKIFFAERKPTDADIKAAAETELQGAKLLPKGQEK